MVHNQTSNLRNLAAQFFLGSIALALVTLAFFRLGIDLASTAFGYLIVIVPFSLVASRFAVRSWKLTGDDCQLITLSATSKENDQT
jgi:hypothetical protein